jgi:hypothetical protein
MSNLKIYNYHPITGEYLSESEAEKDQLDKNNWLIPAHATDKKPPKQKKGHALVFKNNQWQNAIDHRGWQYWLEDGSEHVISNIGEELPEGATTEKPVVEPKPLTNEQVKALRAVEYAQPTTGSDRHFLEAMRKRAGGDEQGAKDAEQEGLIRVAEIKQQHPTN